MVGGKLQAERRLETVLSSIFNRPIRVRGETASEVYQFGTYGVGGYIEEHSDCYGFPDLPMEITLDFKSGNSNIFQD